MIYLLTGRALRIKGTKAIGSEWTILGATLDLESMRKLIADNIQEDEDTSTVWEYKIKKTGVRCYSSGAFLELRKAINIEIAYNLKGGE